MGKRKKRLACTLVGLGLLGCQSGPTVGGAEQAQPMSDFAPYEASIVEMQGAMTSGQSSSAALVDYYLARIAAYDQAGPKLNAVRAVNDSARTMAEQLDAERAAGQVRGPLHGVPVIVKDNYETVEMATTAGSAIFAQFTTGRDATLVARLRDAGAVILAKANMHEFAYGITTFGSLFGQTRNPYNLARNAGGSSGGTASAVAANFAAIGMGSDTCGSIRIPASHNNLVGLRGTQGASSRFGIVPLSHTQDIGGPIARSVHDLALVLDATVGFDDKDPQTAESVGHLPDSFSEGLTSENLAGKRFGMLTEAMSKSSADDAVAIVVRNAAAELASSGAQVVDVSLPQLNELLDDPLNGFLVLIEDFKWDINDYLASLPGAPVTSLAEILAGGAYHMAVEANLQASELTKVREGPDYLRELARRADLRRALLALIARENLDALVYPSIRREPVALGELEQEGSNCRMSAKSGLPAISLPAGFTNNGLPVGMELLGPAWSDARLLRLAYAIEQQLRQRRAPQTTPSLEAIEE